MSLAPAGLDFRVEQVAARTGNVEPLLHQIRHALADLLSHERESCIDLRSLPLTPGEERELLEILGQGEVSASLDTLGHSLIRETRFPGVWLCIHKNQADETTAKLIEITRIPYILKAQPEDMQDGLLRLKRELGETQQTD